MFGTLIRIAWRNLWAHKAKTLVVGIILTMGTILVLLGASLLSTLDTSMSESLIGSIAGHLQVSDANGKDKLVLFPSPVDGTDFGHLDKFKELRSEIEKLPEVEAMIPMGFAFAFVFGGNLLDIKLAEIRKAMVTGLDNLDAKEKRRYTATRDHVKRIVSLLSNDLKNVEAIVNKETADKAMIEGIKDVRIVARDEWWSDFDGSVEKKMEFLENKVARMAIGEDLIPLRYMGTDPHRFAENFSRFEIVEGKMIPKGKRGFLLASWYFEEMVKHKTARRLDKMKDRLADEYTFETDDQLKDMRTKNKRQYKEITYQLDDPAAEQVRKVLQDHLGTKETDLPKLVTSFMDVTEANFAARYKLFYDAIAPHLQLYRIKVGDTITIRGVAKGGYPTSVNVKVYGTFRFKSLEKSAMAGVVNIMDIHSFRELYGHLTADKEAEIKEIRQDSGIDEVNREAAEDALFGGDDADSGVVEKIGEEASAVFDEFAGVDMQAGAADYAKRLENRTYTQDDIDGGIVNNAAIVLTGKEHIWPVKAKIESMAKAKSWPLRVMDWREASGNVGRFIGVIYIVLLVAILGVYGVALFIINNSMVMATMERTREIGTMRAMGAQRRMVLGMFLTESLTLGAVFGAIGSAIGMAIVGYLGSVGIPAVNDILVFLFAGPRLYPALQTWHIAAALALVLLVTTISSLYPAWLAARVQPVEAMSEE